VPRREWAKKWSARNKSSFRSACYWLVEHEAEVAEWRAGLDEADRLRWNYPETVKKRFDAWQEAQASAVLEATAGVDDGNGGIDRDDRRYADVSSGASRLEVAQEQLGEALDQVMRLLMRACGKMATRPSPLATVIRTVHQHRRTRLRVSSANALLHNVTAPLSTQ
jgi:hypothetical protein